jgi:hypothetical protein
MQIIPKKEVLEALELLTPGTKEEEDTIDVDADGENDEEEDSRVEDGSIKPAGL